MEMMRRLRQLGFTLIELVIVLVILGILAAVAIPRYVDLQSEALAAAQASIEGSVKSAFAITIAQNKRNPTLTELAANVDGGSVSASATGVAVTIDGDPYHVQTYTDTGCTTATAAAGNTVACVGTITAGA